MLVLLNSIMSDLMDVITEVPQGYMLGPLLFMMCANELTSQCAECNVHFYSDDTVMTWAPSFLKLSCISESWEMVNSQ